MLTKLLKLLKISKRDAVTLTLFAAIVALCLMQIQLRYKLNLVEKKMELKESYNAERFRHVEKMDELRRDIYLKHFARIYRELENAEKQKNG